jgi:hypothetical protein
MSELCSVALIPKDVKLLESHWPTGAVPPTVWKCLECGRHNLSGHYTCGTEDCPGDLEDTKPCAIAVVWEYVRAPHVEGWVSEGLIRLCEYLPKEPHRLTKAIRTKKLARLRLSPQWTVLGLDADGREVDLG